MSKEAVECPYLRRFAEIADQLDPGIAPFVRVLMAVGISTIESCEGGRGHAYPEPCIRFVGDQSVGLKATAQAIYFRLPVSELRRRWSVYRGELEGPDWWMTFYRKATPAECKHFLNCNAYEIGAKPWPAE